MSPTHPHITSLLTFLDNAPTPYHVSAYLAQTLAQNLPCQQLFTHTPWQLKENQIYYIVREGSFFAFALPAKSALTSPHTHFAIWATHSDSPTLKLKSLDLSLSHNTLSATTEPYGGIIAQSYFNKDLALAGRVFLAAPPSAATPPYHTHLVFLKEHPFTIPALAPHQRQRPAPSFPLPHTAINPETELRPLISLVPPLPQPINSNAYLPALIAAHLNAQHSSAPPHNDTPTAQPNLLGWDLAFTPLAPAKVIGLYHDLIAAPQLDNLAMTHAGASGLLAALQAKQRQATPIIPVLAVFDHEEIGSRSPTGAQATFFHHLLKRLYTNLGFNNETFLSHLEQSVILSADMAHSLHPNYPNAHSTSAPLLGKGPVLKKNSQLRYSTQGNGEAFIRTLLKEHHIPLQTFTARNDIPCGATIGPTLASELGACTLDIGNAMLSMHSTRELMSLADHLTMIRVAQAFFQTKLLPPPNHYSIH